MERFFNKIEKTDTCWIWQACLRGKSGYGCIKYKGKVVDAHRISYMLHKGDIPKGIFVCHTCDNRKCVNPEHLFLGTQSDNMKDAYKKGRLVVPFSGRFKINIQPKNALLIDPIEIKKVKDLIINRITTLKNLAEEINLPYQLLRDISCGRVYKNH